MTAVRVGLATLAVLELALGIWTQWFPASFYALVPTVDLTPPYSEHFVRDFGGATTGIAIVLGAAAVWMDRRLVIVALIAYLVFAVPHTAFHLQHLEHATPGQATTLAGGLISLTLLAAVLLILAIQAAPAAHRDVRG